MKKKIYFLRHGESVENIGTIKLNDTDAVLTKSGIFQAETVASRMKNIDLDIVYSSHFDRALKTAEKIAEDSDVKLKVLDFAYERMYPDSIYGLEKKGEKAKKIISDFKKTWIENPEKIPAKGGESFYKFKERVGEILKKAEKSEFQNIAFVLHGSILRAIMIFILTEGNFDAKLFLKMYKKIGYSNTGLSVLEFSEENGWKIIIWNDYSHL